MPARTSPYQLYQFFLRSEDAVVGTYLRYFTFLDRRGDPRARQATADHPERREAQRELARQVCTLVHGAAEAERAEQAAAALFGEQVAGLDERLAARRVRRCAVDHAAPDRLGRRRSGPGRPAGRVRGCSHPGAGPASTLEQGGVYVNNTRSLIRIGGSPSSDLDRRPLPGAASGQEGLPPRPLRLIPVEPCAQIGRGAAPTRAVPS